MSDSIKTLAELGDEYAAEAERLKLQISKLKRKRRKYNINTGVYADMSKRIEIVESMYHEAHDTALLLQNYYRK